MEKGTAAIAFFGHDIGVGGVGSGAFCEEAGVDFMFAAIVEDQFAERVFADQASGGERKIGAQSGEVNENIIWRAARALRLAADVGQLLALGEDIDELDLVNDPIAAGENAAA